MNAREAILGRLRRAERTGVVPDGDRNDSPTASRSSSVDELVDRLVRELDTLGVNTHVEVTDDAVRARVAAIVASRSVLRWDSNQIPYGVGDLFPQAATGMSSRDEQAAAEIGITGVDAAIAETGSLALLSGEGKPRAASLLPPVHVAICTTCGPVRDDG